MAAGIIFNTCQDKLLGGFIVFLVDLIITLGYLQYLDFSGEWIPKKAVYFKAGKTSRSISQKSFKTTFNTERATTDSKATFLNTSQYQKEDLRNWYIYSRLDDETILCGTEPDQKKNTVFKLFSYKETIIEQQPELMVTTIKSETGNKHGEELHRILIIYEQLQLKKKHSSRGEKNQYITMFFGIDLQTKETIYAEPLINMSGISKDRTEELLKKIDNKYPNDEKIHLILNEQAKICIPKATIMNSKKFKSDRFEL